MRPALLFLSSMSESASSSFASATERVLEIGARIEHSPSDRLIQTVFKRELDDQLPLFESMTWVDLAHTIVMIENKFIPIEAGRELIEALLHLQSCSGDFVPDPYKGDLYTNREAWLNEHSSSSHWLGAGRARREAITTAFHLKVREDLVNLSQALIDLGNTLVAKVIEFQGVIMPDYTYLQAAQPTTFGHYLLGFTYPLFRDLDRLYTLYGHINLSPAGCGSTTGSRIPQQRWRLGELLGFDGLVSHARDAMWQADLPIETAALLTSILINLDRLAEDLQIFATEEFGLIEVDDRHARASKIMPQKKNPFALTAIRGLANKMIGILASSAAFGRTPSGQPDNRLTLYGMIPNAIAETQDAANLMGEIIEYMTFNTKQAVTKINNGFVMAAELAEVLVMEYGFPFREAHRLAGTIVRHYLSRGNLQALTVEELAIFSEQITGHRIEMSQSALKHALNPEAAIAVRTEPGGVAPEAMATMLSECKLQLQSAANWHRGCQGSIQKMKDALFNTAKVYSA